ncbi:unnamed protein product, partial [Coccothraustes coccothraustes]
SLEGAGSIAGLCQVSDEKAELALTELWRSDIITSAKWLAAYRVRRARGMETGGDVCASRLNQPANANGKLRE